MIIGFTGSRNGATSAQIETMQLLFTKPGFDELHHGDCIGADAIAHHIAQQLNIPTIIHPPLNNFRRANCTNAHQVLPQKDYIARNHDIVNVCDQLIAVPSENAQQLRSGTWATIRYARKMGKAVIIIRTDGELFI